MSYYHQVSLIWWLSEYLSSAKWHIRYGPDICPLIVSGQYGFGWGEGEPGRGWNCRVRVPVWVVVWSEAVNTKHTLGFQIWGRYEGEAPSEGQCPLLWSFKIKWNKQNAMRWIMLKVTEYCWVKVMDILQKQIFFLIRWFLQAVAESQSIGLQWIDLLVRLIDVSFFVWKMA